MNQHQNKPPVGNTSGRTSEVDIIEGRNVTAEVEIHAQIRQSARLPPSCS